MKAKQKPSGQDEKIRMILVCGVLLLALVTLILYAITKDTALLLTNSSVLGAGIFFILRYYFSKE